MITARDFYHSHIRKAKSAEDDANFDWETAYQMHRVWSGVSRGEYKNETLKELQVTQRTAYTYSTDKLLSDVMEEVIGTLPEMPQQIGKSIRNSYVIKRLQYRANAVAKTRMREVSGFLIEYWLGFSILSQQICLLFIDFDEIQGVLQDGIKKRNLQELERSATFVERLARFEMNKGEFESLLKSWRSRTIKYPVELRTTPYRTEFPGYFALMRRMIFFVLAHELGHHLFGHTATRQIAMSQISEFEHLPETSKRHKQEIEADAFALRLTLRYGQLSNSMFDSAIAAFLAITGLALINENPKRDSKEHPSYARRYKSLFLTSQRYLDEGLFADCISRINVFIEHMVGVPNFDEKRKWWIPFRRR